MCTFMIHLSCRRCTRSRMRRQRLNGCPLGPGLALRGPNGSINRAVSATPWREHGPQISMVCKSVWAWVASHRSAPHPQHCSLATLVLKALIRHSLMSTPHLSAPHSQSRVRLGRGHRILVQSFCGQVDGMLDERRQIFVSFGVGIISFQLAAISATYLGPHGPTHMGTYGKPSLCASAAALTCPCGTLQPHGT